MAAPAARSEAGPLPGRSRPGGEGRCSVSWPAEVAMKRLTIGRMMVLIGVVGLNVALDRFLMDSYRKRGDPFPVLVLVGLLPALNLLGGAAAMVVSRYQFRLVKGATRDPILAFLVWGIPVFAAAAWVAILREDSLFDNELQAVWVVFEPALAPLVVTDPMLALHLGFMVMLSAPVLAILCLLAALTSRFRIAVRRREATPLGDA